MTFLRTVAEWLAAPVAVLYLWDCLVHPYPTITLRRRNAAEKDTSQ